jgi:hypothetical protein
MGAIASAERVIAVPLSTAFERFVDFSTWDLWMPKGLRPITGPARALREGDSFKVAVGPGLQTTLTVIRVRPDIEICWKGGVAGGLASEHSFFFRAHDGGTCVRSEEVWSGLLCLGPLGSMVERAATTLGENTLVSFGTYVEKAKRG